MHRPLSVEKAFDDVLLAYEMNGEALPPDHGFPVRLVAPGWVGIASVKWLGSLEVSRTPLFSPWNTKWYRMTAGVPAGRAPADHAAGQERVRAALGRADPGRPADPAVRPVVVRARAAALRRGEHRRRGSWRRARLRGPSVPSAWARWELPWRPPGPGAYQLLARATDREGAQPATVPFNDGGYQFWAVVRHPVTVA